MKKTMFLNGDGKRVQIELNAGDDNWYCIVCGEVSDTVEEYKMKKNEELKLWLESKGHYAHESLSVLLCDNCYSDSNK